MAEFTDDMTLAEARDLLRTLVDAGHECPCCRQFAKVYKRRIHSTMAAGLIKLMRASAATGEPVFVEISRFMNHRQLADFAKVRYWGLAVEEPEYRPDTGGRSGWWKITADGMEWVMDRSSVAKYAMIYDGRCLGVRGEPVGIRDALGTRFDYRDLMYG